MRRLHKGDVHVNHPSLNCYRYHECRCEGCLALNAERSRIRRENLSDGQKRRRAAERELAKQAGVPPTRRRVRRKSGDLLSEEELLRLRRAVGLIR